MESWVVLCVWFVEWRRLVALLGWFLQWWIVKVVVIFVFVGWRKVCKFVAMFQVL